MAPMTAHLNPTPPPDLAGVKYHRRRLSEMTRHFGDRTSIETLLRDGDPEIYTFWEVEYEGAGRGLSYGVTSIHPGLVGDEFYMTRGHYHSTDGDEIYVGLEGTGVVLLRTPKGEIKACPVSPSQLLYIETGWGHRTVNTGPELLVIMSLWVPDIEHDYESVVREGYPRIRDTGSGSWAIVDGVP